jgi:conjugative transposon TraM protein
MQPQDKKRTKQKFLIVLPLFLIGLAGLIFAGINILKTNAPTPDTKAIAGKSAFNTKLPAPNLPAQEKNKLEVYMQADKDSASKKSDWEKDALNQRLYDPGPDAANKPTGRPVITKTGKSPLSVSSPAIIDSNEKKVNDRLQKLYAALNQPVTTAKQDKHPVMGDLRDQRLTGETNPDITLLEHLLQQSHSSDTAIDPNLAHAETVLDKVLDIRYPARVAERERTRAVEGTSSINKVTTGPINTPEDQPPYPEIRLEASAFYGLQTEAGEDTLKSPSTIQAVVGETQTLQNGSTIKLRLLQDIFVAGHRIAANNFIYGQCSVGNERLNIQLTSAVCDNEIYSIALKVYDTDGLEGIYVPGAITRDVTKEGISQGISGMGITSLDPSLGAQATAAGIETAKSLLSKKIKAVIVTVKAGHRVLLENPGSAR